MESNHPSMSLNNGRDDEIFDSNSQERSFPIEIEETDFERQFIEIFERIERLEAEVFPEMEEASQRKVPGKKKIRRRAREILKKFKVFYRVIFSAVMQHVGNDMDLVLQQRIT